MSRIEVNSNDVELIDEELKALQKKTKNLMDFVKSNFKLCRKNQLYLNGLSRLSELSEAFGDDAKMLDSEMLKFNDEMSNIEEVFVKKFGDIKTPDIVLMGTISPIVTRPVAKYAPAPVPTPPPKPTIEPVKPSPTIKLGDVFPIRTEDDVEISGEGQTQLHDMTKTKAQWEGKSTATPVKEEPVPEPEPAPEDELSKIMTEAEDIMGGITDSVSHTVSDTMSGFGGEI